MYIFLINDNRFFLIFYAYIHISAPQALRHEGCVSDAPRGYSLWCSCPLVLLWVPRRLLPCYPHGFWTAFLGVVFAIVLVSDFVGFWCQVGLNLPPNLELKTTKNRPKSHPRCIQNRILFLITFWIAFCLIFGVFSTSKSTKNQSKNNQKVNPTTQQPKYRKTSKFDNSFTFL